MHSPETFFEELKRYVRFDGDDEAELQALAPVASPHFRRVADEFYARISEHPEALAVFSGPAQIERLKGTLCDWMERLFAGPWDEEYYALRSRIGRVHVRIGLPQRYMFTAMNLIRSSLGEVACRHHAGDLTRCARALLALHKIFDLELAIMLESYRAAYVDQVQEDERREKELLSERLAISEARCSEIVEAAEVLICTFDAAGTLHLCNRRGAATIGLAEAEVHGRNFFELFVGPADREALRGRADQALSSGLVLPTETTLQTPRGARRIRWQVTTLPGAGQRLLCGIGIDVTDERELATRTRRAERMASLGLMAAGLAHEIRNPLNAAQLQLRLMQSRLGRPGGPEVAGAVEAAQLVSSEMSRLASLVQEFLEFARPQPLRLATGDLRATGETIVNLLRPQAEAASVRLELLPCGPLSVEMDDERIKQVLLNLLRNAIEAVAQSGQPGHVRVRLIEGPDEVRIAIEDDGPGLPPDAPVFDPFYTTKADGTGLGLAIVHRIVDDHGGSVHFASRSGHTCFEVVLPRTSAPR